MYVCTHLYSVHLYIKGQDTVLEELLCLICLINIVVQKRPVQESTFAVLS